MANYIVTEWHASIDPRSEDNAYIAIKGRTEGVISFILTLLKINPKVQMIVSFERVLFEKGSLEGFSKRIVPVPKISSCYYEYNKPLKAAIILALVSTFFLSGLLGAINEILILASPVIGAILGIIYYIVNKTTTIAIVEDSGEISGFQFKRSVIEGKKITEEDALEFCEIIQKLVDSRSPSSSTKTGPTPPTNYLPE